MMSFHHVHLFAVDLGATLRWWCDILQARIIFDGTLAGSRNVFILVGEGRIHFYDQPPSDLRRSAVHHLGIKVSNLRREWDRLKEAGISSPNGLREFGEWRYVMISAPDNVLLELFEFDDPLAPVNLALMPSG